MNEEHGMSNVEVKTSGLTGTAIQTAAGKVSPWLNQNISIAPLAVFRIVFGLLLLGSTIRFWALGWIEDHYIRSTVQFKYYGFDWVKLLPPAGMYALHVGMILGALGIMLGYRYRLSALLFFLTFTYTELIDLTYYLNHYYFVSLISLLLIFLPANRHFSVDAWRNPDLRSLTTPRWTILILQFQLAVVYIFAGLAKINYAWLIEAMPLRIWLPANDTLPLVGPLLKWQYAPWLFSWAGMLYDCTIVFWLSLARTRPWAYAAVIVFHAITGLMFQIGVFPVVMIGATLIFFPAGWHERVLNGIWKLDIRYWILGILTRETVEESRISNIEYPISRFKNPELIGPSPSGESLSRTLVGRMGEGLPRLPTILLTAYLLSQLLFPWRYLLYPGHPCEYLPGVVGG